MLPTFFIIGATKAGTTSLSKYLDSHPEIHMAPVKEPHFFVKPGDGLPKIKDRIECVDEYRDLFDTHLVVRGEASTSYSHYPARRGVPERIAQLVPDARFVYLVRDPIARIVSHYRHQLSHEGERRGIVEVVGNIRRPENIFVCASRYATQLERYLQVFPAERILVIDQDDLLNDREDTLRVIFEFLGVWGEHEAMKSDRTFNVSDERRMYGRRYARFRARSRLRRLPRPMRIPLRWLGMSAERVVWRPVESPEVPDWLRSDLTGMLGEEVERLRELTGKTFPTWSL